MTIGISQLDVTGIARGVPEGHSRVNQETHHSSELRDGVEISNGLSITLRHPSKERLLGSSPTPHIFLYRTWCSSWSASILGKICQRKIVCCSPLAPIEVWFGAAEVALCIYSVAAVAAELVRMIFPSRVSCTPANSSFSEERARKTGTALLKRCIHDVIPS